MNQSKTLYELTERQKRIELYIDTETGEFDAELYEQEESDLQIKRETYVAVIKNKEAEIRAIEAYYQPEIEALTERMEAETNALKNQVERMKMRLAESLNNEAFKCDAGDVTFRRSEQAEPDTEFVAWALINERKDLLNIKPAPEPTPNKVAIKKALKNNEEIPAKINVIYNMGIK